jgi:deferrochelatase/peroxidase EfeB
MVFIALNTNIARQFVFIQQTWVNNPKFQGLYGSRDPIVGANHEDGHHEEDEKHKATAFEVVIPNDPVRLRITGVPRFVHMRGGGYFFVPSIRALRFLSHL